MFRRRTISLVVLSLLLLSPVTFARRKAAHNPSNSSSYSSARKKSYHHRSNQAVGVQRDSRGRIKRSSKAKHEFMKQTGYPHGRPGYVVDHVVPLKRGGTDQPSNMQWQTKDAAKAKDKIE